MQHGKFDSIVGFANGLGDYNAYRTPETRNILLKRDSNEERQQRSDTEEKCANSGVVQVTTRENRAKADCLHDKSNWRASNFWPSTYSAVAILPSGRRAMCPDTHFAYTHTRNSRCKVNTPARITMTMTI